MRVVRQWDRVSDALRAQRRFGRFALVGAVGTLLDFALFTGLCLGLGLPPLAANPLSYSAGIVNNYVLNRRWTFADRVRRAAGRQFLQFALVSLSALLLNTALVVILATPLGRVAGNSGTGSLLAKAMATIAGLGWNYAVNTSWTFREEWGPDSRKQVTRRRAGLPADR